jgi:hypothetical protein
MDYRFGSFVFGQGRKKTLKASLVLICFDIAFEFAWFICVLASTDITLENDCSYLSVYDPEDQDKILLSVVEIKLLFFRLFYRLLYPFSDMEYSQCLCFYIISKDC